MLKNKVALTAGIAILLSVLTLSNKRTVESETFYAMGTNLTISIAEENFNQEVFNKAFSEFKRVESLFKGPLDINNQEIKDIYNLALEIQEESNGAFSPYLGDVISLWQFDKTNKTIKTIPDENDLKQALDNKSINLYAIAKGYGIDKVAEVLKKNNINNFIVNAGGDLLISGKKFNQNWIVGLGSNNKSINCDLTEYAIATSSNLYNYYNFNGKKYGHLINGNTGWPTQAEKSITVIANSATLADAYSTAVFLDDSLITSITSNKKHISIVKQEADKLTVFNLTDNCKMKNFSL
ncbi:MAG TPA: hypothetical protein DCL21_01835 [Alphaproteobacteria bacterium]|nr:hypothetical protein [Alphaproteobacteria bacterium]